jgi:hypothetical protein
MKTILIIIYGLLTGLLSNAQIEPRPIDFSNHIEPLLEREVSINPMVDKIRRATIIDARDDSSEIGYYSTSKGQILMPGLKSPALGSNTKKNWPKVYYIPSFTDSISKEDGLSQNSLLVVIKKLWLSEEAAPILFENGKRGLPMNGWDGGIVCKFEFYLEKDSFFYPLYRVDSIFTFKDELPGFAGSFITAALKKSLDNLFTMDLANVISKRRKLFLTDIVQEYTKNKELAIFKSATFKKGVYKNFEEFKRNSPSIPEYEFKKTEMGDLLYVKENNSEYNLRTAWGFCDGLNLFINSSDKYSKLVQRGNTFYFSGIKGVSKNTVHDIPYTSIFNLATNTGRKKTVFKGILKYYQVDMETGEAY